MTATQSTTTVILAEVASALAAGVSEPLPDAGMIALAAELSALPRRVRWAYSATSPRQIAGSSQDQHVPDGVQNPLWEIVRLMPGDTYISDNGRIEPNGHWVGDLDGDMARRAHTAGLDRTALCARYSWSIPSPGDVTWLTGILDGRGVVEIGAGSGYWAWQLTQAGIAAAAYDPHPPGLGNEFNTHKLYHPVITGDHEAAALHPDRALMLCWPSYCATFAKQALHAYQGDTLIYIGEGEGGCCAENRFFSNVWRDWEQIGASPRHVSYWGIHCELTAYRRKGVAERPGAPLAEAETTTSNLEEGD